MMTTFDWVYLLYLFIIFIIGIANFKRHSKTFRALIILIGITFVGEIVNDLLRKLIHNNMPSYHVLALNEYLFSTYMYIHFLTGKVKRVITYAAIPIVLFAVINSFYIQNIFIFPSNMLVLCQAIYLIYSLLGFRQMLFNPSDIPLYKQSIFWLNIALMFFSSTLFLYYGILNYSNRHHINLDPIIDFSYAINIIYYTLLAASIITNRGNNKLKPGAL
jgi:hypothetical protein